MTGPSLDSMAGRVCLVTGAGGGMGQVIVTELARRGATVVLVCRRMQAARLLRDQVTAATGNTDVHAMAADLSDQRAIRELAAAFSERHTRLHVLVNNAGAHFHDRRLSVDGIELHLAVNHLSWFMLTNLLLDRLLAGAPARVVNVASDAITDTRTYRIGPRRMAAIDLDDLQSERAYRPMQAYGNAKLAMVMCGYALARRLSGTGVTVNALHPGIVATGIIADSVPRALKPIAALARPFLLTPAQGARTAVHLATSPEVADVSGAFFADLRPRRTPEPSYDTAVQERLWQASAVLTGLADQDRAATTP
jgi:NAD(P)-dependent dehydrogenase (short-subunit alcohol dehydrogenase family)